MNGMRRILLLATGLSLATGAAAAADERALEGLAACGSLGAAVEKAACYDAAYARLSQAVKAGDVIIVERVEAQAAQRSAFGLNLSGLSIFDRAGGVARPLESVMGEAARATRDEHGKWIVTLTDGAAWRQTDSETISPAPRKGSQVEIRKAAFGSYMMKVDGQRGVRVQRSQ
jgi:hypothetical protein